MTSVDRSVRHPGNPTPAGQCITTIKGGTLQNAFGALGTSPAFSPSMEFNLRARYDWTIGDYRPFVSVGANHIGSERNEPASFTDGNTQPVPTTTLLLYTMPGYTTYDGVIRRRQGQLDGVDHRQQPVELECQHEHGVGPVHQGGSAAAAAGADGELRHQVLIATAMTSSQPATSRLH